MADTELAEAELWRRRSWRRRSCGGGGAGGGGGGGARDDSAALAPRVAALELVRRGAREAQAQAIHHNFGEAQRKNPNSYRERISQILLAQMESNGMMGGITCAELQFLFCGEIAFAQMRFQYITP